MTFLADLQLHTEKLLPHLRRRDSTEVRVQFTTGIRRSITVRHQGSELQHQRRAQAAFFQPALVEGDSAVLGHIYAHDHCCKRWPIITVAHNFGLVSLLCCLGI